LPKTRGRPMSNGRLKKLPPPPGWRPSPVHRGRRRSVCSAPGPARAPDAHLFAPGVAAGFPPRTLLFTEKPTGWSKMFAPPAPAARGPSCRAMPPPPPPRPWFRGAESSAPLFGRGRGARAPPHTVVETSSEFVPGKGKGFFGKRGFDGRPPPHGRPPPRGRNPTPPCGTKRAEPSGQGLPKVAVFPSAGDGGRLARGRPPPLPRRNGRPSPAPPAPKLGGEKGPLSKISPPRPMDAPCDPGPRGLLKAGGFPFLPFLAKKKPRPFPPRPSRGPDAWPPPPAGCTPHPSARLFPPPTPPHKKPRDREKPPLAPRFPPGPRKFFSPPAEKKPPKTTNRHPGGPAPPPFLSEKKPGWTSSSFPPAGRPPSSWACDEPPPAKLNPHAPR